MQRVQTSLTCLMKYTQFSCHLVSSQSKGCWRRAGARVAGRGSSWARLRAALSGWAVTWTQVIGQNIVVTITS